MAPTQWQLSYKTIVKGNDADDTMSEHKKESIRMKARYLAQAYRIALDSMPYKTWNDCCQETINQLAAVHIRYIKMQEFWRGGRSYWMTPEEREQTRKDQYGSTMIQKEYSKPQLIEMLERERGIMSPKGNRQQIWDMAQ